MPFLTIIHFWAYEPFDSYCWTFVKFNALLLVTSNTLPELTLINVTYPFSSLMIFQACAFVLLDWNTWTLPPFDKEELAISNTNFELIAEPISYVPSEIVSLFIDARLSK